MRKDGAARPADVLLIDDSGMMRCALTLLLDEEGFAVTACATGSAGLALAGERRFAAYVVDYWLPGMKGDTVSAELRRMHSRALIIGCSIESKEQVFLAAGADLFVLKENLHTELAGIIRDRLPSEKPGPDSPA